MLRFKQATSCGRLLGLLGVGLLLAGLAGTARADNIDKKLLSEGPRVMDYLKKHGYKNVGVLPFRVALPGKSPRFNVGDLNSNMAVRLENTLVLLDDPHKPIGILHKAGTVAARSHKRSYAGPKQRGALFDVGYELPWGDSKVKADAFLTGDVKFAADNHSAVVTIKAFDRHGKEPVIVHQFTVKTDRSMLGDSGQSFRLSKRGVHRRDADDDELAADDAKDQEKGKPADPNPPSGTGDNPAPAPDTAVPVTLTILYDGSPAATDTDPNNRGARRVRLVKRRGSSDPTTVQGPQAGQKVVLVLENSSPTTAYAVVLKVNGKNTLDQQTEDAINCSKWVLDPARDGKPTRYEIPGFYIKGAGAQENVLPFRVLSEEESKQKEQGFDLPDHLGLIEMHVFKQGSTDSPDAGDGSRRVSLRGLSPRDQKKGKSRSLADYQKRLQAKTHVQHSQKRGVLVHEKKGRGLIDSDTNKQAGGALEQVPFDNAQEVLFQAYRYYTPGSGGSDGSAPSTQD